MSWAGIDHVVPLDESGIWARKYQNAAAYGVIAVELGGALWLGNDHELGHVFWQTIDSTAISAVASAVMKRGFSRARPNQGGDPNAWFQGGCCESFPSGEVTLQAAFVTPLIYHYRHDHPWIWSLQLLPLYVSVARVKSQAHWQTDVLAGWALGTGVGYWSARRETPVFVQILPHSVTVGFRKRF
jgi:undecaprenyl-diphosphatase